MSGFFLVLTGLTLLIWLYLLFFRGGYWRCRERLEKNPPPPSQWPPVAVLVPARNEADVIARSLGGLLAQDYPGPFRILLIDDHSEDETTRVAQNLAGDDRLSVISAPELPPGWSGKLWALESGRRWVATKHAETAFLWLSDADIHPAPDSLRRMVAKAEAGDYLLVSLMAHLDCAGFWGRLLIPAFVYYFQMLYPFAWVGQPRARTAAAAGGSLLLRRDAFEAAGAFAAIRDALIDDCALAALMKNQARRRLAGGIWLGLSTTTRSLRTYCGLKDIWDMVARSAYTQLRHSPLLLAATLLAMILTYILPPLATIFGLASGDLAVTALALAAWALMTLSYLPTLRHFKMAAPWALLLPLAGLCYAAMTWASAWRHWHGQGGRWKGRLVPSTGER